MVAIVTTYTLLLGFHIFAAVVWVGGALMLNLLALFALRSKLSGRRAEFAREAELVGMRLFAPTSLVLLGLGFWLIHEGHWELRPPDRERDRESEAGVARGREADRPRPARVADRAPDPGAARLRHGAEAGHVARAGYATGWSTSTTRSSPLPR